MRPAATRRMRMERGQGLPRGRGGSEGGEGETVGDCKLGGGIASRGLVSCPILWNILRP